MVAVSPKDSGAYCHAFLTSDKDFAMPNKLIVTLHLQETPSATEATFTPSKETLQELLLKETPAAAPLETILVPAETTVPAVAVSGHQLLNTPLSCTVYKCNMRGFAAHLAMRHTNKDISWCWVSCWQGYAGGRLGPRHAGSLL